MSELETQEFDQQIAPQKVALFERQFGEAYRLLAYHAALPLVLTPELVHYLRTEFLLDLVPWESEADLLLSDLCSQVGYELYAMDTAVRAYLLTQMQQDNRIPSDRMQAVAQVLMSYVQYLSHLNPGQRERERQVQRWAAMAYLGDEQCRQMADEIAQQFEASVEQGSSTAVKAEFARLARITQELEPQLQAHPALIEFAKRVGQALRSPEILTPAQRRQTFVVGTHHLRLPGEAPNDIVLKTLDFVTARFVEPGVLDPDVAPEPTFPPIQTEEFTITTIVIESDAPPDRLQTFEFTVATLKRRGGRWTVRRQQRRAQGYAEPLGNDLLLPMVYIPGGRFVMGSPINEPHRQASESPRHAVAIEPFFMGRYPVTQAQWQAVVAMPQVNQELTPDPSQFIGENRPVERVSWHDAIEFCFRLSAHTGRAYRLPSEAEWEYACRARTTTPFHFGETITPDLANYDGNHPYNNGLKGEYRKQTTPVDHFDIANAFGLCNMHGNVWEWCQDHWHSNYEGAPTDGSAWLSDDENARRVRRGGSWDVNPRYCRSATRSDFNPRATFNGIGFRVVCSAPGL